MRNVKKGTDRTAEGKISCGYRGQAGADGKGTQMPSGIGGKVLVWMISDKFMWNGKMEHAMALNVEEDDFTVVPQKETLSERNAGSF